MVAISRLSSSGENPCQPVVGGRCGYDSNGNRTNGNNSTQGGSDNRQSTDGTYDYSYDGEGDLTGRTAIATGDVRLLSYDYRNRLTELIDHQGSTSGMLLRDITYTYDVNNLRIAKSVNGFATRYVYDGQNLVQEFNPGRSTPQEFLYGPAVDQILADNLENGSVLWALTDNLGSVRDLLSTVGQSPGQLVDHITYTSFGVQTDSVPMTNFLFGFTGAVFDAETGLQYHRARYYDPVTGRWISQDPIGFSAGQSNLYEYVANSPTDATDPTGLDHVTKTVVSKSYINTVTNIGWLPGLGATAKLWAFAHTAVAAETDGQVWTPANDGNFRLRAQLDISLDVHCGKISNLSVAHSEQGGNEGLTLVGSVNVVEDEDQASDSVAKIHWITWGAPSSTAEGSFQYVFPRTSTKIWHQGTITITANGESAGVSVEEFLGSNFPSHRLWIDGALQSNLGQGPLSSLWRSDTTKGPSWVTRDGTGPFTWIPPF